MNTLLELFQDLLKDVYFAETAITKALPKMEKAATSPELKKAFAEHLAETRGQIHRLDEVFALMSQKPEGKECHAIMGLIAENDELIGEQPDTNVLDAGLLAGAQAVEHYEMARYGTLRAWADCLGMAEAAHLLEQTLAQEKSTDAKLSVLAVNSINGACETGLKLVDEPTAVDGARQKAGRPPAQHSQGEKAHRAT